MSDDLDTANRLIDLAERLSEQADKQLDVDIHDVMDAVVRDLIYGALEAVKRSLDASA